MKDNRLTHEESQGVLKDVLERFSSHRGRLWHKGQKRFLTGTSTEFYMLGIGSQGSARNLLQSFSQAGFSFTPLEGQIHQAIKKSKTKPCYGDRECFRMMSVRGMGFKNGTTREEVRKFGRINGCVATSFEAACELLLETVKKLDAPYHFTPEPRLLGLAPTPFVWTFVGGDHNSRTNLFLNGAEPPRLVALVSEDAKLGLKGIVEANEMNFVLSRDPNKIEPSDMFVFSIDTATE